jgi:hypothetical protein
MKPLVISLLLVLPAIAYADPGWQNKIISNVQIEVPSDSKIGVQNTPGASGAVQKMTKYSVPHSGTRSGVGVSFVSARNGRKLGWSGSKHDRVA